jgi:DNA-binding winged helix-turn-helix (wHTH) protein/Tol biopolymer transport system component
VFHLCSASTGAIDMSIGESTDIVFTFGPFDVNPRTGELKKQGVGLRLPDQSFQILAILLQKPGQMVSREELQAALWPGNTLVDSEKGLNAAINRLREALGDSADNPRYVETLPRRGYRFIAQVSASGVGAAASIAGAPVGTVTTQVTLDAVPRRRSTVSSRNWAAAGFLCLIVLSVLVWTTRRLVFHSKQDVEYKLTTNSSENNVTSAAISPDGRYLAYSDSTGVYLKIVATGETHPVPLPSDFYAHVDDWFQDGSHLLVTRPEEAGQSMPGKLSLWSISVFGGSPRQLAEDGRAGSVSPDGSYIAFQRYDYGREEWVMRADGTEQLKVAVDQSSWVGQPTWSPDGNRIAYVRSKEAYYARESSIEVNEWRKARSQTLLSDNRLCPSVYWLPNGSLVYCLGDVENQQGASLWTMRAQQSQTTVDAAKRLTPREIGWVSQFTGSDDGGILTFLRENSFSSIYVGKMAQDSNRLLDKKNITIDENQNFPSAWTPDSRSILFHSDRNGTSQIFRQVIDQRLAEVVISSRTQQFLQPKVTPDGSEILFIATPKTADMAALSSILAVPIGGGPPRTVLQDIGIWSVQCSRLPSTSCMYSNTKGDTTETYRFDARTGKNQEPPQVDPPCNWSLSPDGLTRAIVPAGTKGRILLRSTLSGETRELIVKGWDDLDSIDWSSDGKNIFAGWHHESDSALLRISLDGSVSVVLRSANPQVIGAIQSPDGQSLAFAGLSTVRNAWKIENF